MQQYKDDKIEWAGFRLPSEVAVNHFCVMGAIGSGTSLTLNALMASVLREVAADDDRRVVILDAKGDLSEFLQRIEVSCPIYNLNPFDGDGLRWDIGADWTEPRMAHKYAELLVPDPPDELGKFFVNAARRLLEAVLIALMQRGSSWTLADLVDIATDVGQLRQTILTAPDGDRIIDQHFTTARMSANTTATLATAMMAFEEVAATTKASSPDRRLGIRAWSKSKGSILVLGLGIERELAMSSLCRLVFDTICQSKFDRAPSPPHGDDWFFLHDIGSLPHLDSLPRILTEGRSIGARVAFSFHDQHELTHLYGEEMSGRLPALCGNRSILRLTSIDTAEWAAELASEDETFELQPVEMNQRTIEVDLLKGFRNREHFRRRSKCKPEDFLSFPRVRQGQVVGCHVSQSLGGAVVRSTSYDLASNR